MKSRYEQYVADYRRYAQMRGFKTEINDWHYVRRSFIECWAEPGFHRFWQVWNPGIAYFVYRLYLLVGGRKRWLVPTLISFFVCGLVHTLVVVPFFGYWSYSVIVAFSVCGIMTVLSRLLASVLCQERWPRILNVIVNVGLVLLSFDLGFKVDHLLG